MPVYSVAATELGGGHFSVSGVKIQSPMEAVIDVSGARRTVHPRSRLRGSEALVHAAAPPARLPAALRAGGRVSGERRRQRAPPARRRYLPHSVEHVAFVAWQDKYHHALRPPRYLLQPAARGGF